jgi:hypothetical protein
MQYHVSFLKHNKLTCTHFKHLQNDFVNIIFTNYLKVVSFSVSNYTYYKIIKFI